MIIVTLPSVFAVVCTGISLQLYLIIDYCIVVFDDYNNIFSGYSLAAYLEETLFTVQIVITSDKLENQYNCVQVKSPFIYNNVFYYILYSYNCLSLLTI